MNKCPTADQLQHMLDDALSDEDRRTIEPHLDTCPACRAVLDGLTANPGLPAFGAALLQRLDSTQLGDVQASPRYRFMRHHKGGGAADIFEFYDEQLQRSVALKLLRDAHADADLRRRFLNEALITARLAHPGIVQVYALAQTSDGQTGCVMALVNGDTLGEAIGRLHERGGFPARAEEARSVLRPLLTRFIALCNTVAYAHSQKVLHRDIKPGNVILGVFGETVLVDWGMAKAEGDRDPEAAGQSAGDTPGATLVMSGARGTVGFMSPEQAVPGSEISPASDIYSLGATLYTVLTGLAPFPSAAAATRWDSILQQIRRGEFRPPAKVNPNVHPDLQAVCLKAMAVRPGDRYADATALAADVDCWLAGEPVSVRREPPTQRAWRWMKRHRVGTVSAAAAILVALIASAVAVPFLQAAYAQEKDQRTRAEAQRARADSNLKTSVLAVEYFLGKARSNPSPTLDDMSELRSHYLPSLIGLYKQLIVDQADPSPEARQFVARAHYDLGLCCTLMTDLREAETHFRAAQTVQEELLAHAADPFDQANRTVDLVVTLFELAQVYRGLGRRGDEETVRQKIAGSYASFADRTKAFVFAVGVAKRFEDVGLISEPPVWLDKVIDELEPSLADGPRRAAIASVLAELHGTRALLRYRQKRYNLAIKDWDRRSELTTAPLLVDSRVFRVVSMAHLRKHIIVAAEVEALANTAGLGPENYYNLALALAVSVSSARLDAHLPPAEREDRADRYAKDAVALLRKGHATGLFQIPGAIELLRGEATVDALRTREDFQQFLSELNDR
jgi:serine/threonine protein kinase